MIDIKLSTCAPTWPWLRQFPGGVAEWGDFRFHIDTEVPKCDAWVVFESLSVPDKTLCPAENTIFITGEPDGIGHYSTEFLNQFHWVVTCRTDLKHPRILRVQQGHPWFVEKSFDELMAMPPIQKTKDVCVISSNKTFTLGHRQRLEFVEALKARLGDRIDVFGRGIRDFDSKWDVLANYRYAVVLENSSVDDYLSEKLPDAWLAYCYPIYFGCNNIERYASPDSYLKINFESPIQVAEKIELMLNDPNHYCSKINSISRIRETYLTNLQFFANLGSLLELTRVTTNLRKDVQIRPDVMSTSVSDRLFNFFNKLKLKTSGALLKC